MVQPPPFRNRYSVSGVTGGSYNGWHTGTRHTSPSKRGRHSQCEMPTPRLQHGWSIHHPSGLGDPRRPGSSQSPPYREEGPEPKEDVRSGVVDAAGCTLEIGARAPTPPAESSANPGAHNALLTRRAQRKPRMSLGWIPIPQPLNWTALATVVHQLPPRITKEVGELTCTPSPGDSTGTPGRCPRRAWRI